MEPTLPQDLWAGSDAGFGFGHPPALAGRFKVAAHGAALFKSHLFGWLLVDAVAGVTGPYPLGEVAAAAFGSDGTLYISRAGGTLLRSRRLPDGAWSKLDEVGRVPHPDRWAAAGRLIAASDGERVLVSSDEGATFAETALSAKQSVASIWVRGDDVIVIQTSGAHPATLVSVDRGKTFQKTVHVANLLQLGGWIYGHDYTCAGKLVWAALASDGRTWVQVVDEPQPGRGEREGQTAQMLVATPEFVRFPPRPAPWADELKPPSATLPKFKGSPLCELPVGVGRKSKTVKMLETGTDPSMACTGVGSLRHWRARTPRSTRTSAYLLHDAQCVAAADAVACPADAPLSRPPHAVFVTDSNSNPDSTRSLRVLPVPSGCQPRFITYAAGLVVLPCAEPTGQSKVHVATSDGHWIPEATLGMDSAVTADDFEMRTDGTAMFATYVVGDAKGRAWVRTPVELGNTGAWRDITRTFAAGYVLRKGGVVDVAVAEPERGPDVFTLIEDAPGKPSREILSHVSAGGDLWCISRSGEAIVGMRRLANLPFEEVVFTPQGTRKIRDISEDRGFMLLRDHFGACGEPEDWLP